MRGPGFNRPPPPPAKQYELFTPRPRTVAPNAPRATQMVLQVPKMAPNRPGKRTPTAEESAWMCAIAELGCIACWIDGQPPRPTAIHHMLSGGRRIGHLYTLPLCDPGHHQNGASIGLISRHPWKARFEDRYGSEDYLLERSKKMVASGTSVRTTSRSGY